MKLIDILTAGGNTPALNATIHGAVVRANQFRDRWGWIHAPQMHPELNDPKLMKPARMGIEYLLPIFTDARARTTPGTCGTHFLQRATWRSLIIPSTRSCTNVSATWKRR